VIFHDFSVKNCDWRRELRRQNGSNRMFFRHGVSRWRQSSGFFDHPDLEMYISNLVILGYFGLFLPVIFLYIVILNCQVGRFGGDTRISMSSESKEMAFILKALVLVGNTTEDVKACKDGYVYQHGFSKRAVWYEVHIGPQFQRSSQPSTEPLRPWWDK